MGCLIPGTNNQKGPGMVAYASNPNTLKAEEGASGVQDHLWLLECLRSTWAI